MPNKTINLITTLSLFLLTYTTAFASVTYSPYVDITIDTHWSNQYNGPEPLDLTAISASQGIQSYHLAFINDAGNCTPAWGGLSNISVAAAWGKRLTDKLTAQGIKYDISFGGSDGKDMSSACSQDQLTAVYEQVLATYHPQGLDFDIENGTADVPKLISSVQKIQAAHPGLKISFTLPVMPSGLLAPQQAIVDQAHAAGINFSVNIMTMCYRDPLPPRKKYDGNNMGPYSVQALQNTFAYLQSIYPEKSAAQVWQMLQFTPEIGVNDIKTQIFTLSDADLLKNFAEQQQILSIDMWSLNRDKPCTNTQNLNHCSGNNTQTIPYEFTQHFLGK